MNRLHPPMDMSDDERSFEQALVQRTTHIFPPSPDSAGYVASSLLPPGLQAVIGESKEPIVLDEEVFRAMKAELIEDSLAGREALRRNLHSLFEIVDDHSEDGSREFKVMGAGTARYEQLRNGVETPATRIAILREQGDEALFVRAMACYALGEVRQNDHYGRNLTTAAHDLFHAQPL